MCLIPEAIVQISVYLFIYYSPSFNPLQGTRPTGCGSSQDTLDSYNKSIT